MGGRIRDLGTSESWLSLGGGHIRCLGTRESWFSFYTVFIQGNSVFIPLWSAIPILVGFLLVLHSGFLFQEVQL
jgi:hypothetical protein